MSTGEQSQKQNNPSFTVTVQNLKTLKGLEKQLFKRFYLGYPYCLEKDTSFWRNRENLIEAIKEIKKAGLESYLVTPVIIQSSEFDLIEDFIDEAIAHGLNGVEINDVGVFEILKDKTSLKLCAGHFANIYHPEAALEYEKEGITTIIPNSELTLEELKEITMQAKADVEVAVYGNLPLGYTYDCLLKNTAEGKCRQQCNKHYYLNKNGFKMRCIGRANITASDFCLIEQIEELKNLGADFWRFEMYQDSAQKINKVAKIFKNCIEGGAKEKHMVELAEMSDNGLCNGWFFGQSGNDYVKAKEKVKL